MIVMRMLLSCCAVGLSLMSAAAVPPLKGLVLWPDEAAEHPELREAISLEFSYMLPCRIVEADGSYDWRTVERMLDGIASRGHQAILRFRYEYPGEVLDGVAGATAVPASVRSLPGYHETFAANPEGDGPTWYADWSQTALEQFTSDFFRAFAERYDRDPRLAYLEVGFGHWSEYHTSGTPTRPGVNFPTKSFQSAFIRQVVGLFKDTPVLVSVDAQDSAYSPLAEEESLRNLPYGLFDDSFMHAHHDHEQGEGYNEMCWSRFGGDHWKLGPCGGEISYCRRKDQREFLAPKGLYGVTWEQAAARYHMTFVIANDSLRGPYATPQRFRSAARACGPHFVLRSSRTDATGVHLTVANVGVAPPFHDLRVRVGGEVSSASLRGLLPKEERTFHFATTGRVSVVSQKFLPGVEWTLEGDVENQP